MGRGLVRVAPNWNVSGGVFHWFRKAPLRYRVVGCAKCQYITSGFAGRWPATGPDGGVFLLARQGRVHEPPGVALRVAQLTEDLVGLGDHVGGDFALDRLPLGHHQGELGHLPAELGDDPLRHGRPDPRQRREQLGVLLFDRRGHVLDRPGHRPQGLPHPHAVDRAKKLEKLPLHFAQEADQPGRHAALHRIAFEVLDGEEADRAAHLVLQVAAGELGNEHLVLEAARPSASRLLSPPRRQLSRNFGDQRSLSFR